MSRIGTLQETGFLKYFRRIDKRAVREILSQHRSTGSICHATSLVLARILKVKNRVSYDRELNDFLSKIHIYCEAIGIKRNRIPAHNTFNTPRTRLGPEGVVRTHKHFILQAYQTGLLTSPRPDLPNAVRDKIILIGDSTFLKTVARTKGQKDENGKWVFTDDSIAFWQTPPQAYVSRRPSSPYAYSRSEIPVVILIAPSNESDKIHILPL